MRDKSRNSNLKRIIHLIVVTLCIGVITYGQTSNEPQPLLPNQTLEREMTGAETHRYKFDLKQDEFFQVRVEQKGVDVMLKLLDMGGNVLATMDSPNGKDGFETLTFVAAKADSFILEVINADTRIEKATYIIKREASRTATAKDRRRVEIERAFVEGMKARDTAGLGETAVEKFLEALAGWQELADNYMADLTAPLVLHSKGRVAFIEARNLFGQETIEAYRKALAKFQEANRFYTEGGDKNNAAISYMGAALVSFYLNEKKSSIEFYFSALRLYREVDNKSNEAAVLYSLGQVYIDLGEIEKAIEVYNLGLALQRAIGNKAWEATMLLVIGLAHSDLGERQKALDYFNQAKIIFKATSNKKEEATTLNAIGSVYSALGEKQNALENFNKALEIQREIKNISEEAITLNNIARVYENLGEKEKAISFYQQSLIIFRELNDRSGDATTLNNLGAIYSALGEKQKALAYYEQALSLRKESNDKSGEAVTLSNIGLVYSEIGDKLKALDFYNRALPLFKEVGNKSGEAATLSNIGLVNSDLGKKQIAIDTFKQVLLIQKSIGDKKGEAVTLSNIGRIYDSLGDSGNAKKYFQEALAVNVIIQNSTTTVIKPETELKPTKTELKEKSRVDEEARKSLIVYQRQVEFSRQLGVKSTEAASLTELMRITRALDYPIVAISYGKQAVNVYQQLRNEIKGGDIKLQNALLPSFKDACRILADILIEQGRIPEAEQVLTMLKEEEYFDYLRRDGNVAKSLSKTASIDPNEAESVKRYEDITAIGKEYGELFEESRKPQYEDKTFPKQARLDDLKKQLDDATTAFTKFLEELKTVFGKEDKRVAEVQSGLQAMLKSMKVKRTAIVSTIVGDDRLNIIVTTPDAQVARTVDIKAADVNKLVAEFREAVTNPSVDPRDSGKKLYDILIKPIEKDLAGIDANTIVWSLDGTLRYAPVAALWDGESYLAQRYANVIITLASQKNLEKEISDKTAWRALGVGVSKSYENFPALGAVPDELDCIITDTVTKTVSIKPQCQNGVVNGKKLIDDAFTKEAFKNAMGRYSLVHIASHFSLQPGDDKNSFLLLGGGAERKLSVSEINQSMFGGVELLTLSACNTAVGTEKSNGVEVEGFGAVAQNQGAKAVIATLWAVADPSTRDFMVKFYSLYDVNKNLNKAEALRQAQLSLLQSKDIAATNEQNKERSEPLITKNDKSNTQKPYTKDPKKPYAHPYYWAPFILIGNWR